MDLKKFFTTSINDNTRYLLQYHKEKDCYNFNSNDGLQEEPLKILYYGKFWCDDRDLIHPALSQLAVELNEKLQDDGFIEKYTYLFNKEEYDIIQGMFLSNTPIFLKILY